MNKFCPTNVRHMLECVDHRSQTYACIECEHLYELHDNRLIRVEYRPIHEKNPFYLARETRERRNQHAAQREMWRNDLSIQRLHTQNRV